MHVHIDELRQNIDPKDDDRISSALHQRAIRVDDRVLNRPVTHVAPVDEAVQPLRRTLGEFRRREPTTHFHGAVIFGGGQRMHVLGKALAEYPGEAPLGVGAAGFGHVDRRAPIVGEFDRDVRIGEGHTFNRVRDVTHLGSRAFEELLSRGHVEEQITHLDGRARRSAVRGAVGDLAPDDDDSRAFGVLGRTGGEREPTDRRDRRDRFATKAKRGDGRDVLRSLDLRCRVSLEAEQRVVGRHARAIVGDSDQIDAAPFDRHFDPHGAGVHRVLQQLLDNRSGALHDFASRDLVRNDLR